MKVYDVFIQLKSLFNRHIHIDYANNNQTDDILLMKTGKWKALKEFKPPLIGCKWPNKSETTPVNSLNNKC